LNWNDRFDVIFHCLVLRRCLQALMVRDNWSCLPVSSTIPAMTRHKSHCRHLLINLIFSFLQQNNLFLAFYFVQESKQMQLVMCFKKIFRFISIKSSTLRKKKNLCRHGRNYKTVNHKWRFNVILHFLISILIKNLMTLTYISKVRRKVRQLKPIFLLCMMCNFQFVSNLEKNRIFEIDMKQILFLSLKKT